METEKYLYEKVFKKLLESLTSWLRCPLPVSAPGWDALLWHPTQAPVLGGLWGAAAELLALTRSRGFDSWLPSWEVNQQMGAPLFVS